MPTKTTDPLTPREFISAFRDLVGDTYLIKLFQLSPNADSGRRSLNRWTAKLPYVDEGSIRENWIEKHEKLLQRIIIEPGGLEIARSLVSRHADMVDCDLISRTTPNPDKTTIEDECLDDYPGLVNLHDAIRQKKPVATVKNLLAKAKRELDETLTLYETQGAPPDDF